MFDAGMPLQVTCAVVSGGLSSAVPEGPVFGVPLPGTLESFHAQMDVKSAEVTEATARATMSVKKNAGRLPRATCNTQPVMNPAAAEAKTEETCALRLVVKHLLNWNVSASQIIEGCLMRSLGSYLEDDDSRVRKGVEEIDLNDRRITH